ncbi:MAG: glucose-6-phosphate dehydrogenase [Pseudomonadota bacterium]|nr:glucose-6-phosphate dehydrogenase [Pseudomonadota bacterium]
MDAISPFDIVIFGGSGDLAMRKLLPALYHRHKDGQLPEQGRIIGVARSELSREEYLAKVEESCRNYIPADEFTAGDWQAFAQRVHYQKVDAGDLGDFQRLADFLSGAEDRVRMFFLSTAPSLFATICQNLHQAGLITPQTRVVLEKPLGHNLESAKRINRDVGAVLEEHQIFRIDHYLGKETVQNLMALRFGNALFEPLWRRGWISHVQITVAESVGVEGRGEFYDKIGAMRDMVQNHILQMLCILAMEPPISIDPDAVRDEKLKVLKALKPITERDAINKTVRGQYRAGAVGGSPVPAYLDEPNVPRDSATETFVALKVEIETWRWAGVPFFLRTGKRMQEKITEIVVFFREVPHSIFNTVSGVPEGNRLVIRLHPQEGLKLFLMAKSPGDEMRLRPVNLNLNFSETFKTRQLEAYERLMMDVLRGNLTLFVRNDELEAAWRWVDPIFDAWRAHGDPPKTYNAGTWGPSASTGLIGRDGFSWHEEI